MKYSSIRIYIFSITITCSIQVCTAMTDTDLQVDICDTLEQLLDLEDINPQEILQRRSCVSPEIIVPTLSEAGVIPILEENLYKRTNVPNNRSLLDEPIFEPELLDYYTGWAAGFDFFWNQTNRMNLSWNSNRISSYLALTELSLIQKLEQAIDTLAPIFSNPDEAININRILTLASNISVTQRRIGFMVHGTRTWKHWRLRFFFPLYYLERNFFLTNAERDELAAELGFDTKEEDETFQNTYLVADKIGFGDTRLELDKEVFHTKTTAIRAGFLATIPTAFSLKNGLKGNSFKKTACLPPANLIENLFCIALSDKSDEEKTAASIALLQTFGLGALERLSANLLETPLGNDGHLGIGALTRFDTDLTSLIPLLQDDHHFNWRNRISLEYQVPHDEKRFFVESINEDAFAQHDFTNPDQADENLAFLENELVKRLYPVAFDVLIQPGIIFRLDSRLCYEKCNWGATLGTELWAQSAARFKAVDAFGRLASQINIPKAKNSGAFQFSVFGALSYILERPKRTWILSLNGDTACVTRGIGKDFSVSFNVETHF